MQAAEGHMIKGWRVGVGEITDTHLPLGSVLAVDISSFVSLDLLQLQLQCSSPAKDRTVFCCK